MNKRRLVALLEKRLVRRLTLAPATIVLACVGVMLSPLLAVLAVGSDLAQRRERFARLRLLALVVGALILETIGMVVSFFAWIATGFGLVGTQRWRWHLQRGYMGVYTSLMFKLVLRVVGSRAEWRDRADLSQGPVVVIARHTSFFDALVPATVLSRRNQLLAHHVVTHGLRYSPCIDIVGHRFPNRFIKRTPGDGSKELGPIKQIGAVLDERSGAIIFPEGTFRTDDRFERVVRRIRRRQPERAARAEELVHVLPPRSNGAYALLQGAPDADVVVCVNTGLESFGSIKAIVDRPFIDHPVIIETWRISRSEVPEDADGFSEWLFDQYVAIDAWVAAQRPMAAG